MTTEIQIATEIIKALISGVVGYVVGNRSAKVRERRDRVAARLNETINLVRDISSEAIRYFTDDLNERDKNAAVVKIHVNMKRLSSELVQLASCSRKESDYFSNERRRYHDAITSDPFGDNDVQRLRHDHARISRIQECERFLVDRLRSLED